MGSADIGGHFALWVWVLLCSLGLSAYSYLVWQGANDKAASADSWPAESLNLESRKARDFAGRGLFAA